jgi:hypothetical protein
MQREETCSARRLAAAGAGLRETRNNWEGDRPPRCTSLGAAVAVLPFCRRSAVGWLVRHTRAPGFARGRISQPFVTHRMRARFAFAFCNTAFADLSHRGPDVHVARRAAGAPPAPRAVETSNYASDRGGGSCCCRKRGPKSGAAGLSGAHK